MKKKDFNAFILLLQLELNPMSARNFPPSFWNSNYVSPTTSHHQMSELYSAESGLYPAEPWVHNTHYGSYAAHAYHHNMAQYGSLLRLPQQYGHSSRYETSLTY